MAKEKKARKTMKYSIIFSLVLSLIILIIILYLTINPDDIAELSNRNIRYEFFIAAIFLNFLSWCIWGLRLKILANSTDEGVKITWWKSTKIVMANLFLAGITPSMAGGEPVRIHLLNKEGLSVGSSTASVLGERLIDAVFLLICVPFAFFIFRNYLENYALKQNMDLTAISIALGIGIILFLVAIFLFLYAIYRPKKVKNLVIWINNKFARFSKKKDKQSKVIERINCEVDNFHTSMMVFLKKKKSVFFIGIALTCIMWLTAWLIASMILLGLGLNPFVLESISAQVFLIIIIMMPTTPGAAGVTEGSVAVLYSVLIGTGAVLGVFVILFRFITYHMNIIVGAFFQYKIFRSVASFSMDMIKKQDENNEC